MRRSRTEDLRWHILRHAAQLPVHGAWFTDDLAQRGLRVSPGTLYPALHRLEAEGLLTSRNQVVNGRARRVYRTTDAGLAMLVGLDQAQLESPWATAAQPESVTTGLARSPS